MNSTYCVAVSPSTECPAGSLKGQRELAGAFGSGCPANVSLARRLSTNQLFWMFVRLMNSRLLWTESTWLSALGSSLVCRVSVRQKDGSQCWAVQFAFPMGTQLYHCTYTYSVWFRTGLCAGQSSSPDCHPCFSGPCFEHWGTVILQEEGACYKLFPQGWEHRFEAFNFPFPGTKGPITTPEKQPHTLIPPPPNFTLGKMQSKM